MVSPSLTTLKTAGAAQYVFLLATLFSQISRRANGSPPDEMIYRDLDSWSLDSPMPLLPLGKPESLDIDNSSGSKLDDWCNMPHVSSEAYITPPEEYALRYVEVIQRHHKRTPYSSNLFYQEDVGWDCSASGPLYGLASMAEAPLVQWQTYGDNHNPFLGTQKQPIIASNCQFPQLTPDGFKDSIDHGNHLREVYAARLALSETFDPREATFRVTNNPLTSQVASGVMRGFYPHDTGKAHEVLIQPASIDSLEPRYSCPGADALRMSFTTGLNGTTWKEHLHKAHDDGTFAALDRISGIALDDGEWHVSFDHYFDNLRARECHSKPLPCNLANRTLCISQELAHRVYSIGNWEYSYLYRDAPGALGYATLKFGAWMLELESHLRAVITREDRVRYRHNIAHDGSISSLLGFLQVSKMAWPGMGSEVVFELYQRREALGATSESSWYIRVLWSGSAMETATSLGKLDMVPVEDFLKYIRSLVPDGAWLLQGC